MIGHMLGTLSELPVDMLCKSFMPYAMGCDCIAFTTHELLVEPLADTLMAGGFQNLMRGEMAPPLDPYHLSAGLLGSVALSQTLQAFHENGAPNGWATLFISSGISLMGSLMGTSLYDYLYTVEMDHSARIMGDNPWV